jgi:hypothetical protein
MGEMNRNQNQEQHQGNKADQQERKQPWDGNERRTGGERRNEQDDRKTMQMNEGSSR